MRRARPTGEQPRREGPDQERGEVPRRHRLPRGEEHPQHRDHHPGERGLPPHRCDRLTQTALPSRLSASSGNSSRTAATTWARDRFTCAHSP